MFFETNILKKIFILAALNLIAVLLIFGLQTDMDTPTYVAAINYLNNHGELGTSLFRLLKPFGLFAALIFTSFLTPEVSLLVSNIFFYFGAVYLIYFITFKIYQDKKTAFFASLFFMTAYPLMRWGLAALTDMSGWCFYLLGIYLSLYFYENRKNKLVWLNGFLAGVGMFFKETAAVGALYFGSVLLFDKSFSWSEKIKGVLKYTIAFLSIIVPISLIILYKYDYTFIQWFSYAEKIQIHYTFKQSLIYSVENLFALMFLGWFFVFRGLIKVMQDKNINKNFLWAFMLPSLSFLIWPFRVVRLMFIAGPALCLLAARGLEFDTKKKQYFAYSFLIFVIFFNYFFPRFVDLSMLQDLIDLIF